MPRKVSEYYINDKEMIAECREYRRTGVISEKLGEMFIKIARRFANSYSFSNFTYRDEMIGDAIYLLVRQVGKYDPDKGTSAFSFFSQCVKNEFYSRCKKEYRQSVIKEDIKILFHDELAANHGINIRHDREDYDRC